MEIFSAIWVCALDKWTLRIAVLSVLSIFRSLVWGIREELWAGEAPPFCNIIAYCAAIVKTFRSLSVPPTSTLGTKQRDVNCNVDLQSTRAVGDRRLGFLRFVGRN